MALFLRLLAVLAAAIAVPAALSSPVPTPIPIVVDTDIGTDIDDAFALALILKCPELQLLGVTTVSGDTQARARIAAKFLWSAGGRWRNVPVYAGSPGPTQRLDQGRWAEGFSSPALHLDGAVPFLEQTFRERPGKVTLVALGELTNVASVLREGGVPARQIRQIVLMGGAIRRGYRQGSPPEPVWNFRLHPAAAGAVFSSGIPIVMAPLDVTAMLQFDAAGRKRAFERAGDLAKPLEELYRLWGMETPTLFDPMAVAMLVNPEICRTERLSVWVDRQGMTQVREGQLPNTVAGVSVDPAAFLAFYLGRVAP